MRKFILICMLLNFALSYQLLAQNSHDNLQQKSFINTLSVYPNPIEDKINVNFIVKKDAQVTIRLMDVLGNEITTILNEKYKVVESIKYEQIFANMYEYFIVCYSLQLGERPFYEGLCQVLQKNI